MLLLKYSPECTDLGLNIWIKGLKEATVIDPSILKTTQPSQSRNEYKDSRIKNTENVTVMVAAKTM
ncbi:hypothetical protein K3495_g3474 [Podosphaera aphanis]|nr:hypothetical protein K3495_g3474 [Podosphaera aphanis]